MHDHRILGHLLSAADETILVHEVVRIEIYFRNIFVALGCEFWSESGCFFRFWFAIHDNFELFPGHVTEVAVKLSERIFGNGSSTGVDYAGSFIEYGLIVVGLSGSLEKISQSVRKHLNIGL